METLGIIGGMGPMATAYLLELVIQMTNAKTDQEHLRTIVFDNPRPLTAPPTFWTGRNPPSCRCWRTWPRP